MQEIRLDVPSIAELAELYRAGVESKQPAASALAEAAILQVATAEAMLAEAAVLTEFVKKLRP